MKNCVLKGVLALSLASSFALAQGGFVGVEGGYDFSSKITSEGDGLKDKNSENDTLNGVDGTVNMKWTTHKFVVGGDYTPTIANNFKLVAGLYTGLSVINYKANFNSNTVRATYDLTKSGWLIGTRLGAEYSFDGHNAIEFGIKADKSWYHAEEFDDLKSTDIGAYLGYTYKF